MIYKAIKLETTEHNNSTFARWTSITTQSPFLVKRLQKGLSKTLEGERLYISTSHSEIKQK